jgi:hypothetical protein
MSTWFADAAATVGLLIFIGGAFVLASAAPALMGVL